MRDLLPATAAADREEALDRSGVVDSNGVAVFGGGERERLRGGGGGVRDRDREEAAACALAAVERSGVAARGLGISAEVAVTFFIARSC